MPDSDATFDALLASILAEIEALPEAERTKEQRELLRRHEYQARPLDERMLEKAYALTHTEYLELRGQLRAITNKGGDLTPEDRDEMRRLRELTEDHPSGMLFRDLLPLRGRGPQWLDEHIQEALWTWAWWTDYLGYNGDDAAHMTENGNCECPLEHIEAVTASRPYPDGWKPETRR